MNETPIRSDRALIALFALVTRSFFLGLSLRGGMLEMRTSLPSSTSYFADLTTYRYVASNRCSSMSASLQSFVPAHTIMFSYLAVCACSRCRTSLTVVPDTASTFVALSF